MKHIKQLLVFFLIINVFTSCEKEEVSYALDEISAPSNVNAHFDISQDEVGLVSLTPTAEGATLFEVYFGDTENETPVEVEPGETITHIYAEGEYNLRIVAVGLTGLTSEFVRVVTISMEAPVDLQAEVEISPTNPFEVTVTPSATNATVFDVYFTDAEDEEPITIMVGDFATYEYAEAGDYTIRIVARGAGAATAEITKEVTITGASEPVKLPITFDDATVNYVFTTFNGSSFEIVDNPDVSGVNDTESRVGAITNSGAAYEGGSFSLGTPVDFSGEDKTITMMFWSDVSVPVLLKFEGGVAGERQTEVVATHGGTGWELLSFNFATDAIKSYVEGDPENGQAFVPSGKYATLVLFIDGPGTTAGTFYIDNIKKGGNGDGGGTSNPMKLPLRFDDASVNYEVVTFNGASFEVLNNPDVSGVNNTASKVGAITNSGAQYEGVTFELDPPVDFGGDNKTISMKFWSDVTVPVLLKFEGGVAGERQTEVVATHGGTGWELLSFNFATDAVKSYVEGDPENGQAFVPSGKYASLVLFIDGPGTTAGTFYIDDIEQTDGSGDGDGGETSGPTAAAPTPTAAAANVKSIFSDAYTDPAGVNYYPNWGQSTTYEIVSIDGNEAIKYSNLNYQGIEIGENVDATAFESLRIDVWSGDYTSLPLFLISSTGEKSVTLSLTPNEWNSIEIPLSEFTSQGLSINDVFQFKFDVLPDNGGSIYIDNLYFYRDGTDGGNTGGGSGGDTTGEAPNSPIDFETGGFGADWTWTVFENESNPPLEIVANPSISGINTSSKVAKFTALQAGQPYAGVESKRNEDIGDFTFDATNSIVKIMVYKTVISDVGLKFSEANGEAQQEIKVANTKINEWEELTFDLSGSIGAGITGVITQIIIFPDFQSRSSDNVVYFDNITFGSN